MVVRNIFTGFFWFNPDIISSICFHRQFLVTSSDNDIEGTDEASDSSRPTLNDPIPELTPSPVTTPDRVISSIWTDSCTPPMRLYVSIYNRVARLAWTQLTTLCKGFISILIPDASWTLPLWQSCAAMSLRIRPVASIIKWNVSEDLSKISDNSEWPSLYPPPHSLHVKQSVFLFL